MEKKTKGTKALEAVLHEIRSIENEGDKRRTVKEYAIAILEAANLDLYTSDAPSTVISGIVRYSEKPGDAEKTERENKARAVTGRKIIASVSKGGKAKADANKSTWKEIDQKAAAIWQRNPRLSKIEVAKRLQLIFKLSVSTIRQKIKKPQK